MSEIKVLRQEHIMSSGKQGADGEMGLCVVFRGFIISNI